MPSRSCLSVKNLPDEVILNILSHLPVKTICNFRSVCKKWYSLISEDYFAYLYMQRSPQCILVYQYRNLDIGPPPGILILSEIESESNQVNLVRRPFRSINIANLFPDSIVVPVGSVNGLICLSVSDRGGDPNTYICNPVTSEYIRLPKPQFYPDNFFNLIYGFGVSTGEEYKVIRISNGGLPLEVEVYTLGMDRWRTVGQVSFNVNGSISIFDQGLFFDGHVYWIVEDRLFSFNLDNETFQRFPVPSHGEDFNGEKVLGVLKGCLSLLCKHNDRSLTMWVRKEREIDSFWHKELDKKEAVILSQVFEEWSLVSLIDGLNGRSLLMVRSFDDEEDTAQLVAYCVETNETGEVTLFDNLFTVLNYQPCFRKLLNFQSHEVHVF